MRSRFLLILFLFAVPVCLSAQAPNTHCGEKEVMERLYQVSPEVRQSQMAIEAKWRNYQVTLHDVLKPQQTHAVVTLPVVIHIVHNNGTENISDAQALTAIQHLNEAFANTGYYDPSDGVNTQVQFCLAQRDPNNNPTNGIERIVSPLTVVDGFNNTANDIALKNLSRWNPSCYINIWLVKDITGPVAGYAYLPSAHGLNMDGIVMEAAYFGSSYPNDVVIIHEMGHYLGLYHTFEGGCKNNDCTTDGDQVCDTPPDQSTAGIACSSTINSCSTDALSGFSTDVDDLHKDYMDYGNWSCMKVFTQGQSDRMNWMIQHVRKSLLACKSCMPPCPAPVMPGFSSSANNINAGTTVNFTNTSLNASSYRWYINGQLQSLSAGFSYTFNNAGVFIVKLTGLTNNALCDSAYVTDTIRVTCPVTASFTPAGKIVLPGETVNFINTSVSATAFTWKMNGTLVSSSTSYSRSFTSEGYYTITLIATNGICSDSSQQTYLVRDTLVVADSCGWATFRNTYGNRHNMQTNHVATAENGSSVFSGILQHTDGTSQENGFIFKINASGKVILSVELSGLPVTEIVHTKQTKDGGYIAVGDAKGYNQRNGMFVCRLTAAGGMVWTRFLYSASDPFTATDISELDNGQFAVSAIINSPSGKKGALLLLDASGNLLWAKRLRTQDGTSLFSVVNKPGGNLIFSGHLDNSSAGQPKAIMGEINSATGTLIQSFAYQTSAGGNTTARATKTSYGFLVSSGSINPSGTAFNTTRFDESLNMLSCFQLNTGGFTYFDEAAPIGNTEFLFPSGSLAGLHARRINTAALQPVVFSKTYSLNFNRASLPALAYPNGYLQVAGRFADFNVTGLLKLYVVRTGPDGNTPGCPAPDLEAAADNTPFLRSGITWQENDFFTPENIPINLRADPMEMEVKSECKQCDSALLPPRDTCQKTFQKRIGSSNREVAEDIAVSSSGEYLVSGTIESPGAGGSSFDALLIKLDPFGNRIWQKTFGGGRNEHFSKMLVLRQGQYVLMGITQSFRNANGSIMMVKTDSSGAMIWQKEIMIQAQSLQSLLNISGLVELADGSIAFCGNGNGLNTDVTPNIPTLYNFIGRTDANGNLLWLRRMRYFYWESGYLMTGLAATGAGLVALVGDGLMKVQQSDGALMGMQKIYPGTGFYSSIQNNQDKLVVYSNNYRLDLDTALNLVSVARYGNNGIYFQSDATEKGTVMPGTILNNNDPTDHLVHRFSDDGKLIHSYRFPINAAGQPPVNALRLTPGGGVFGAAVVRNQDPFAPGMNDIYIIRTDSSDGIPGCPRASFSLPPTSVQTTLAGLTMRFYPVSVSVTDLNLLTSQVNLPIASLCVTNCNLLQLSGPDTVCSLSDTVLFTAARNPGCNGQTEWIIDSSRAKIISFTDSTLYIQFLKAGPVTLIGRSGSECLVVSDSLLVEVLISPDSIRLGPDLALCQFSTLTLHAGKGFRSYRWQDGSTDSTLTVYVPGIYHVTAENFCGIQISDTILISQAPDIPFDLGPDVAICQNDTLTITAPAGFARYSWSPDYNTTGRDQQTIRVSPRRDTMYRVVAEKSPGCQLVDSIRVTVNQIPVINVGPDTSFCINDTITLSATTGFIQYTWNTGETNRQIRVFQAGQYIVTGTDNHQCRARDTVIIPYLYELPKVNLGADTTVCTGNQLVFDPGVFDSYLWYNGTNNRTLTVSDIGTYWVTVSNSFGCKSTDTVRITALRPSPNGFVQKTAEICVGQKIELKAVTGYRRYKWYNGSNAESIIVTAPGFYWLEVTNDAGCTTRDTVQVKAKDCKAGIFFPNAFTPGNAGTNNIFRPVIYGSVQKFHFTIFNRWGQKVFETFDPLIGWDGTLRGVPQKSDGYVWIARYQLPGAPEKIEKGTVVLVR